MARLTFVGGIHPYEGKELTKDKPIKTVLPKGDLVYPVSQHIGAPATPIVAVGDHVLTGQKIAEASGFVSAPVYATVSGTVKTIEPRRLATGGMSNSIIVENDEKYEEVEWPQVKPLEEMTAEEKAQFEAFRKEKAKKEQKMQKQSYPTQPYYNLSAELSRLEALKAVNPNIRDDELAAIESNRQQVLESLNQAGWRLDALRLIVVTHQ